MLAASAAAVFVLSAHTGAWAWTPPSGAQAEAQDAGARAQAVLSRAETVTRLLDQAGVAIQELDFPAAVRSPDPQTVDGVLAQLDGAEGKVRAAAAELRALPPWMGASEDDWLIDTATKDAAVYIDDVLVLLGDLRHLLAAVRKGDQAALQPALARFAGGAAKLVAGQALSARTRAAMMPKDSGDREVVLAQAEIYDGLSAVLTYVMANGDGAATAKTLRGSQGRIVRMASAARDRWAAQKSADRLIYGDGLKDKTLADAFERTFALQEEMLLSLERSAAAIGVMAAKLEAAGATRVRLRQDIAPIEAEEAVLSNLIQQQVAALQAMLDRASQLGR